MISKGNVTYSGLDSAGPGLVCKGCSVAMNALTVQSTGVQLRVMDLLRS